MSPLESIRQAMAEISKGYTEGIDPPCVPRLLEALKVAILEALKVAILNLDDEAEPEVLEAIAAILAAP